VLCVGWMFLPFIWIGGGKNKLTFVTRAGKTQTQKSDWMDGGGWWWMVVDGGGWCVA